MTKIKLNTRFLKNRTPQTLTSQAYPTRLLVKALHYKQSGMTKRLNTTGASVVAAADRRLFRYSWVWPNAQAKTWQNYCQNRL